VPPATLTELFAERRTADGSTVLLETPDGIELTYDEAERRTAQLAHALTDRGVRPGDRVAVQIEKSPLAILLYLASVRCGAVLVPMNPAYTDDEVDYLVRDAEPTLFVRGDDDGGLVESAAQQPDQFDDVVPRPHDGAAIVYTSGTTGRPKGALLSHRNLASNAATLHRIWGFRPDDVLLHALPVFHVHGLFVATNCVLANGTGMVYLPRFDVDAVVEHLPRCTVFMGVPTYYRRLLAEPRFDARACRTMRLFVSGSAPLPAATHGEFRDRTGHVILERYGMSETGMITSNPLDGDRMAGTVGVPLPDVEVRISDPDSGEVLASPGAIGGIEVRGPNVFGGYWRRPELSASELTADGFFRTGDVGSFDQDGYLTIAGRSKDVIISGGLNVYPKEVEEVVDRIDGVAESAVVGLPDPDFGEVVVGVVVLADQAGNLDEDAVRAAVRQRLAAYKVPKRVHIVEALPRNAMGKVEKARLRAELAARGRTRPNCTSRTI
jgi:malonyl-CoA/methylmalonyl-CoA synthetase